MKPIDIARVAHEANRAYCLTLGDRSQLPWDDAPNWQRESSVNGVQHVLTHGFDPEGSHISWMNEKLNAGWQYGPVKDALLLTHPCLVDYDKLPPEQRVKDSLFGQIVLVLSGMLE
jgi:hypothetical protein